MSAVFCTECGKENKYSYSDKPRFCGFCGESFHNNASPTFRKKLERKAKIIEEDDEEEIEEAPIKIVKKGFKKPKNSGIEIEIDNPISTLGSIMGTSRSGGERNYRPGVDLKSYKDAIKKSGRESTNIGGE